MNNVFGTRKNKASYVAFSWPVLGAQNIQCGQIYIARYLLLVRSQAAISFRTLDT